VQGRRPAVTATRGRTAQCPAPLLPAEAALAIAIAIQIANTTSFAGRSTDL
jgi:hypothetical protein